MWYANAATPPFQFLPDRVFLVCVRLIFFLILLHKFVDKKIFVSLKFSLLMLIYYERKILFVR